MTNVPEYFQASMYTWIAKSLLLLIIKNLKKKGRKKRTEEKITRKIKYLSEIRRRINNNYSHFSQPFPTTWSANCALQSKRTLRFRIMRYNTCYPFLYTLLSTSPRQVLGKFDLSSIKRQEDSEKFFLVTNYFYMWIAEFEVGACRAFQFCDIATPSSPQPPPSSLWFHGIGALLSRK